MVRRSLLMLGMAAFAVGAAEDPWEKVVLLQKVKRHMAEAVKQLPDYTCLQTAARYRKKSETEPETAVDRVVLEVLNSAEKELYASPGEKSFQADSPAALVGHGMTGTGAFALFLRTLFINDNGQFQWAGEEDLRGRKVLKWNFRVPTTSSGYTIAQERYSGRVGMRGWMLIDPATLDLVRLAVNADDIPPTLPIVEATQVIEYAPTRIGDRDVMLPQSGTVRLAEAYGAASRNEVAFTHCQSFRVESTLSFTTVDAGPATVSRPPEPIRPIGEGLTIAIELVTPVTARDAVGALIEGRVAADVRERGRVAIRAGAAVRGRIRRLEPDVQYMNGRPVELWVVGLEFTEVETAAGSTRFYAIPVELDKQSGATLSLRDKQITSRGSETEQVTLPTLPGVAHFYVPKLPVAAGFKTIWKTTSPRSANR